MSKLFFSTMREVPSDATIKSHQLMLRAGLIRKLAAGIYTFLPLGLRVIKKISNIVEEEMNNSNAQEIFMPMVQPAELWRESGRYDEYGPELLRFKDRKESEYCLGPTHEEVVTALVRDHVKSYKSLPLNLYQIQTKFRDEIRPRFGLMRGREFIMKDAYSFCLDKESQYKVYDEMSDCYHRIFTRCGLNFRKVRAATGAIGGDLSHEFQVLAHSGEDAIAACNNCDYAANVELAKVSFEQQSSFASDQRPLKKIETKGQKTIDEITSFLNIKPEETIKSVAFDCDGEVCLALVRGDHDVSEAKLKTALNAKLITVLDEERIIEMFSAQGFIGPINVKGKIKVIIDHALFGATNMVCGANKRDHHLINVDVKRDITGDFADIKQASAGDKCGECGKEYSILRGIEVGHIFCMGQKYSKTLKATVQDEKGENKFLEMGSYGIGIGRTAAAAIEQHHDEKGIIWPKAIAPFHVHLVVLGNDEEVCTFADELYKDLRKQNVEVLYDDRDERAGVKLNDADLIGCPLRIAVGKRGVKNNEIEVLPRNKQNDGPIHISLDEDYISRIKEML